MSARGHRPATTPSCGWVIDLHCHLLPGIDDGPPTLDDALALAGALVAAGVQRVVATPHVSPQYPNDPDEIDRLGTLVMHELRDRGTELRVEVGGELDLQHALQLSRQDLDRLRLGASSVLLVECPFSAVAPQFEARVRQLSAWGHRVLLAHPERSPLFLRDQALLGRLVADGAFVSLTGASFAGDFGRTPKRFAAWAVDEGLAHDVATDAHNVGRRGPVLREALSGAGYRWAADWLTREAPEAILAGATLPPRPVRRGRMGWKRLRRASSR